MRIDKIISIIKNIIMVNKLNRSKRLIKLSYLSMTDNNTHFEGQNRVDEFTQFTGDIGYGSYIGKFGLIQNTKIGKFTSIADSVKIINGIHPTHTFVSTSPMFYSLLKQNGDTFTETQKFNEYRYADEINKYYTVIGNDVWIGSNVLIMGGIKIGDGAIIAAGAVVTKDVEPYSIVAGVPAKIIRKRFTNSQIDFLNNICWWDKPISWINDNANLFTNIDVFMDKYN